jgi:hypothetical protein
MQGWQTASNLTNQASTVHRLFTAQGFLCIYSGALIPQRTVFSYSSDSPRTNIISTRKYYFGLGIFTKRQHSRDDCTFYDYNYHFRIRSLAVCVRLPAEMKARSILSV